MPNNTWSFIGILTVNININKPTNYNCESCALNPCAVEN